MTRGPALFLGTVTAIPAVTLAVVLAVPPPNHGYLVEQAALLGLGLLALLVACLGQRGAVFTTRGVAVRPSSGGAVLLYCTLALGPVLAMLDRHHDTVNDPWALVFLAIPALGLIFVTFLTKSGKAILFYGLVALLFYLAVGGIYDKPGLAGILGILSAVATGGALVVLDCSRMKMRAEVDRVRESTGKLGALANQINEKQREISGNDP